MRIEYSGQVKKSIAEIADYTEQEWGKSKRIELIKQIAESFETILQFPHNAKFDLDLGLHYKILSKLPFIIVYSVETDFIRVVKIIHMKRNRSKNNNS